MARRKKPRPVVTVEEIKSWGVWTTIENAGRAFGMSRSVAYDLKRRGKFPVPIVMVGTPNRRSHRPDPAEVHGRRRRPHR